MSLQHCKKIIGIGWNYAKHAAELGNKVPKQPVFFLKPPSSLLYESDQRPIELPSFSTDVHHEIELGVVIGGIDRAGKKLRNVSEKDAMKYVSHFCLALDMTCRDLQMAAKKNGAPWSLSKGLDTFCPIGALIPASEVVNPASLELKLYVDGLLRQDGSTADMVFKIPRLISYLSSVMSLEEGDLILTGTPEGVGSVKRNQKLRGELWDHSAASDGKMSSSNMLSKIEFKTNA